MKKVLFAITILCNITIFTNARWFIAKNEENLKCRYCNPAEACYVSGNKNECEKVLANLKNKYPLIHKDSRCIEAYPNVPSCPLR